MTTALKIEAASPSALITRIQSIVHQQASALVQNGHDVYVISGSTGRYTRHTASNPAATVNKAFRLPDNDKLLLNTEANGRPVAELLWSLAIAESRGQLLPGCRRDDVVHLTRWPNFTRLPTTENSLRIAALLTARPTSLVLASRILDIDESEVFSFYSAASYAGYTRVVNRIVNAEQQHKPANPARLGLISKLMDHLKSLQGQRKAA